MDYEKKYNEALERARALRREAIEKDYVEDYVKDYETIFPELRESEDERIRKTLAEYFAPEVQLDFVRGVPIQKIRDWLEKQKPVIWSEEDEKMLARIIERGQSQIYMYETGLLPEHIAWLKSLRPDIYKNCNNRRKPGED